MSGVFFTAWTNTDAVNTTNLNTKMGQLEAAIATAAVSVVSTTTTPYSPAATDGVVLVNASGGAKVVTMPLAATTGGRQLTVIKTDSSANTVALQRQGADTLGGNTSVVLSRQYEAITLVADGTTTWLTRSFNETWFYANSGGHLTFSTTAGQDIGASGANQPRNVYVGGQALAALGSASAPAYSFDGDTNTGVFSSGADTLDLTTGGTSRWRVTSSGHLLAPTDNSFDVGASGATRPRTIYAGTSFLGPDGTVSAPAFSFASSTNTGLYLVGAGRLGFTTGGTGRWEVNSSGHLVAGTTNSYDLGSASAAPRNGYFGTGLSVGSSAINVAAGNGQFYLSSGTSATIFAADNVAYRDFVLDALTVTLKTSGTSRVAMSTSTWYPTTNGGMDLGSTSNRWATVYAQNALNASSRAAKREIVPVAPADALDVALGTRIYRFKYKGNDFPQLGFMADEAHPWITDGESASAQTTASLALAGLQALAERLQAAEQTLAQLALKGL